MNAIVSSAASADSSATPITNRDSLRSLRLAISDPGAFLARGDNYQEPLIDWQVRAVMAAVGAFDAEALRAENEDLRAELEPYEVLNPQQCAKEVHVDWLVDSEHTHACPWCRIDELTALLKRARAEARTARGSDEYPPALPWAALMDDEDLTNFLDELAASAITNTDSETALAEVEDTCGRWRAIAEAQHAHNTAAGPDAVEGGER